MLIPPTQDTPESLVKAVAWVPLSAGDAVIALVSPRALFVKTPSGPSPHGVVLGRLCEEGGDLGRSYLLTLGTRSSDVQNLWWTLNQSSCGLIVKLVEGETR